MYTYFLLRWLVLILLGLLIYGQTFHYGFVFDDRVFILTNPYITHFNQVHLIWHQFPMTRSLGFYSFALNYHFDGLQARGYHIFNFIVHLLGAGLVWALASIILTITQWLPSLERWKRETPFLIALLFLVHPCQTQAVSYISQRFESMATVFYLATIYCYLRARIATEMSRKILFMGLAVLGTLLGILTKEVVITVPIMMLVSEWILFPQKSTLRPYLGLAVAGVFLYVLFTKLVYANLTIFLHPVVSLSHDGDLLTPAHYFLTQLRVFLTFLRLLVVPIHQNLDYDYPASSGLLEPPLTLAGLYVIGAIVILIIKLRPRDPLIAFGLAWILVTFSINLAPRANVIFEHKLYLISFGFFLAAVAFLFKAVPDRGTLGRILLCWIAVLSVVSFERNKVWRDEFTLWNDIVQKSPHKARVYINRAIAYSSLGNRSAAIADDTKAIAEEPNYADAYYNRGLEYYRLGNLAQAIVDCNKAIILNPRYAEAYNNRGLAFFYEGNLIQAVKDYTQAIDINHDYAAAYNNRAILYYRLRRYDQAWEDVHQAQAKGLSVNPGFLRTLLQVSGGHPS